MKKILGIIALGLLLSTNAFAETQNYDNGDQYVGQTKLLSGKRHGQGTYTWADGRVYVGEWKKDKRHGQGTYTWPSGQTYVGEFKDGKKHGQGTTKYDNGSKYVGEYKNGKRDGRGTAYYSDGSKIPGKSGIYENGDFVRKYVEPVQEKKKVKVAASSTTQSSTTSTKDKIIQSKQICTDLGFQPKTEKHADCSMQMMSIQFETTNKVSSASGGTTQEVVVTHRNDYDIWDALLDFSAAIDPKNQSTSSSSSSNRGTNCVVGRTNPTFGTTTINCR